MMVGAYRVSPAIYVVALIGVAFFIVTIIDMARRPSGQWRQARSNKVFWVVLEVVAVPLTLVSIVVGIVYFATVRPRLVAVARSNPPGWSGAGSAPGTFGTAGYATPGYSPFDASAGPPSYPSQPAEPPPAPPFGWYPDPSTHHELRYWDGTRWTEHVSDQGVQSTDSAV